MSIAAFVAGVDRILTRAHGLYPAGAAGGPLPTSGGAAVPASPQGAGGLQGAATRAAGAYQQARGGAAALDQELQRAAEQGGAIGAQGRLGSGVIRDQARAVAAAAGPLTKSPAGAHLIMAAMDQHLAAMQGQLQTTKTENQAVSATLRQTTTGYQALSNGAKDSPADPTIRAAGWRPGDQVPASPAPPGLPGVPPVATDPRNPFVGDPRFGYWDTYTPPPYTGPRPPPPTNQHVPWRDGPEGGPTGFYTPGRTWIGDNDAPFASYQQQYKLGRLDRRSGGWPTPTRRRNSRTSNSTGTSGSRRRRTRAPQGWGASPPEASEESRSLRKSGRGSPSLLPKSLFCRRTTRMCTTTCPIHAGSNSALSMGCR